MSAALSLSPAAGTIASAASRSAAPADATIVVLRARNVTGILPRSGQLVRSEGGGIVYLVLAVHRVRTAGDPESARVRLTLRKLRKAAVPADEAVLPWPAAKAPVEPVQRVQEPPAIAIAPLSAKPASGQKKASLSGAQRRREKRRAKHRADARQDAAPDVTQRTIRDGDGKVLRPPLVTLASWRDPEDRNTSAAHAKLVRGWVKSDGIAWLSRRNRKITDRHVAAADCYRYAYERAHRSPGAASLLRTDGGSSGGGGPTETLQRAVRAWNKVQGTLSADARGLLEAVVLNRGLVSAWAETWGLDTEYAVGFLIAVLDQLATYYRGEIDKRLKDGVVIEG